MVLGGDDEICPTTTNIQLFNYQNISSNKTRIPKQLGTERALLGKALSGSKPKSHKSMATTPNHTGKRLPAEAMLEFPPGCTKGTTLHHPNIHTFASTSLLPSDMCQQTKPINLRDRPGPHHHERGPNHLTGRKLLAAAGR